MGKDVSSHYGVSLYKTSSVSPKKYEMYRSLYDYFGRDKGVLPVHAGELFYLIKYHDSNWWKVRSQNGSVGLVPACYMEAVDQQTVNTNVVRTVCFLVMS